jgi:K+-sensing histidine kinase KdpD
VHRVHQLTDLRQLMEDEYLDSDMAHRWRRYDAQLRKPRQILGEIATKPPDAVQSPVAELQKGLATFTTRDRQSQKPKMQWLNYLWTVIVNCCFLLVVAYVFDKLDRRPEIVIVAILGLVYVAICSISIAESVARVHVFAHLNEQLLYVRRLLRDPNS